MGKYINKGNDGFVSAINSGFVDKSLLLEKVNLVLNTENRFLCITRARRFGKSVAVKMLNAYYDESCQSAKLFENLKISRCADYATHINHYPVIYLDMTDFITKYGKDKLLVDKIKQDICEELLSLYNDITLTPTDDLMDLLFVIVKKTGKQFICLIDEWDAICREGNGKQMDEYVDFLRRLFKGSRTESVFACVYMTGILPIKRYNTQSALNNFEEYTMLSPADLASYFGFTEEETSLLCDKAGMDLAEMKHWYDGYWIGDARAMFNPYAVMRALRRRHYENYWTSTNTFESLRRYISMDFEGLKDDVRKLLADIPVQINTLRFPNDMHQIGNKDDVLTVLCHLGYLSFDWDTKQVRIPNYEIRQEFETAVADSDWTEVNKALQQSEDALRMVLDGDAEQLAQLVEQVHMENTSILKYNDENALACVLSLAFYTARNKFQMIRELPTGRGFADVVLIPLRNIDLPAIVLELKFNQSVETAISQIHKQHYGQALQHYVGDVLLVGINYDKKQKIHTCHIEKITKSNTYEGKSNTNDGKSNTYEGKSNTNGGKSNTNDGKSNIKSGLTPQQQDVVEFCSGEAHTAQEIFAHLHITIQAKHYRLYIKDLLMAGALTDATPEKKRNKQYIARTPK